MSKVILTHEVDGLGSAGEVVDVGHEQLDAVLVVEPRDGRLDLGRVWGAERADRVEHRGGAERHGILGDGGGSTGQRCSVA